MDIEPMCSRTHLQIGWTLALMGVVSIAKASITLPSQSLGMTE